MDQKYNFKRLQLVLEIISVVQQTPSTSLGGHTYVAVPLFVEELGDNLLVYAEFTDSILVLILS